jgi:hypothetical protein
MSERYMSAAEEGVVLRKSDCNCHRLAKQRVGNTDYCELHLMMELLELQDEMGMKLVRVAFGE